MLVSNLVAQLFCPLFEDEHEIPGGQHTNLLFRSRQLSLIDKWPEIKRKYAEVNMVMDDIPKVIPSS